MKAREMINILEDFINEHGEDVELNLRNWQNGENSKIVEIYCNKYKEIFVMYEEEN